MKLNKERQKLYLDGKVGLINDGTVDQLREVTEDKDYLGSYTYYHKKSLWPSNAPYELYNHHPIAWYYEETEFPKRVKYMGTEYDVVCETYPYYRLSCGVVKQSDCTPITETTPSTYKLKIDIPEWLLKAGDEIEAGRLPRSIIEHIATPCTTFTLENGTQIELTANDIDKIKKL